MGIKAVFYFCVVFLLSIFILLITSPLPIIAIITMMRFVADTKELVLDVAIIWGIFSIGTSLIWVAMNNKILVKHWENINDVS